MKDSGYKSIFCDYFHWYTNINLKVLIWLFIRTFLLPGNPENKVCVWLRMAMKAKKRRMKKLQAAIERHIYYKYNCVLSADAEIGQGLRIPHPLNTVIGLNSKIGKNLTIYQDVTIGQSHNMFPEIGDNVIIYAGAKVFGDIQIGSNVIIGANSVVTHDIPDNCIVAGNPAKVIKSISNSEMKDFY